jgi:protein SCO1
MKKTLVLFGLLCLLSGCSRHDSKRSDTTASDAIVSETPISGESIFNLTSEWNTEEGKKIRLSDLKGKVLVMVMIYTSCNYACPRLVADMMSIRRKVPEKFRDKVQYVLVSIDPEHDSPEKLKSFAIGNKMDSEEWTFLQGNPESVREFANVLAVKYKEISPVDFSHSNIISVFNPSGDLVHQQEGLDVNNAETVQKIITTSEQWMTKEQ